MPTDVQTTEIKWGVDALRVKRNARIMYRHYYNGKHQLMIDDNRLRSIFGKLFEDFNINLCPAVVDALADRLQVQSFSTEGQEGEEQNAADIWKHNRMQRRAGLVHLEAISTGDAYLLVWPNDSQQAIFYPHKGDEIAVDYDPDNPGTLKRAAKMWREGKRYHLNLYYPDRIEKYATPEASQYTSTGTMNFERWRVPGETWPLANQYGVVPVFHFANNADLGEYGVSELANGKKIQDMMNYLVFNLLVGVEYQAFPQRYALNIDVAYDSDGNPISPFKSGPDKVWALAGGENVDVGQFAPADLDKIVEVKRETSLTMAQVTGTPPHYFMLSNNFVSGESQKTAEQKLDSKVNDRTISFGDTWAAAMGLAVRMERGLSQDGLELQTNWKDTKPRNEVESWTVAESKEALGVSRRQILREMGYTDKQIDQFEEDRQNDGLGNAPNLPALTIPPTGPPNPPGVEPRLALGEEQ